MGDQVGIAVGGTLYFVPFNECERIRSLNISAVEKTELFATICRINTLYMIARAGSGHIGSSFSSMEIMSWIELNELTTLVDETVDKSSDIFFSSKGHDAPGLYSVWLGLGKLDFDLIHQLRRLNGLPGHPDINTPNVITNTGSLGMGVSKAKGMIFANRYLNKARNIYVLTGDGELQEGQFWESLISAANDKLNELTVIIDHNKLQSDTLVVNVSDLGDLESKLSAFGWHVSRCDGNDLSAFSKTLNECKRVTNKPKVIIADTIKGKGVSFMEHTSIDSDVELYKFHSGAPTEDAYVKAAQELINAANAKLAAAGERLLLLETFMRPMAAHPEDMQRLIPAYSKALIQNARKNPRIVALDADLILDTGLIPFREEFPERFIECGIAEQDMVSQAGGMALEGIIPVVHSFACFLTARPNEQIYNNCTENTKVVYVGSLSGLLPAGPGHSHQALRDVAIMSALPDLVIVEPICESQVEEALTWAIDSHEQSTYLRLTSIPCEHRPELINISPLAIGRGHVLRQGSDAAVIVCNPVLVVEMLKAADLIHEENGVQICVVGMPWLNHIDEDWFIEILPEGVPLFTLENHYISGGFGLRFLAVMMGSGKVHNKLARCLGVENIPASGQNAEVLEHHGLDALKLAEVVLSSIR